MANEVDQALREAQRRFWTAVISCGVGLCVCLPHLGDAEVVRVRERIGVVERELDAQEVTAALVEAARVSAPVSLGAIAQMTDAPGVRNMAASEASALMRRVGPVEIATLGELLALSKDGYPVPVVEPDLAALAQGLRWRVARAGGSKAVRLSGLRLSSGRATRAQLQAEQRVEGLRLQAIRAGQAYRHDARRFAKRRAGRGHRARLRELRGRQRVSGVVRQEARDQYREAAATASAVSEGVDEGPGLVVVASFEQDDSGLQHVFIPVPARQATFVAPAAAVPAALRTLSKERLWPELEDETPAQASAHLQRRLSWHLAQTRIGPLVVRGATLLLLLPLFLAAVLLRVERACPALRKAFNPFDHPGPNLPFAGTRSVAIDVALLVVPVTLVVGLDVWTLIRIAQPWWIALSLGALAIATAVAAAQRWAELRNLRGTIVSTSLHPPAIGLDDVPDAEHTRSGEVYIPRDRRVSDRRLSDTG